MQQLAVSSRKLVSLTQLLKVEEGLRLDLDRVNPGFVKAHLYLTA